jgi:hypothetical protein
VEDEDGAKFGGREDGRFGAMFLCIETFVVVHDTSCIIRDIYPRTKVPVAVSTHVVVSWKPHIITSLADGCYPGYGRPVDRSPLGQTGIPGSDQSCIDYRHPHPSS